MWPSHQKRGKWSQRSSIVYSARCNKLGSDSTAHRRNSRMKATIKINYLFINSLTPSLSVCPSLPVANCSPKRPSRDVVVRNDCICWTLIILCPGLRSIFAPFVVSISRELRTQSVSGARFLVTLDDGDAPILDVRNWPAFVPYH